MIQKNNLNIAFGQGLDTKTDSKQVSPGKMLALSNAVFQKGGLLQKRNGFGSLPALPALATSTLTTFGDSLTAIGQNLYNYAPETGAWYNKGSVTSVSTSTVSLVRSATSQTQQDVAVTPAGLSCAVWKDSDGTLKYQVNDTLSSQVIVAPVSLVATATLGRVFILGPYFIVTYLATVAGATHLQYVAIPTANPGSPLAAADVGLQATSLTSGYDAAVANGTMYFAWSDIAPGIKISYMTQTLGLSAPVLIPTRQAKYMSLTVDTSTSTPTIWLTYFDNTNTNLYTSAYNSQLSQVLAPTVIVPTSPVNSITTLATGNQLTIYYQQPTTYPAPANTETDFVAIRTCTTAGVLGTASVLLRGVGIASKAFFYNSTQYLMVAYGTAPGASPVGGVFQPTYFLIDSSANIIAKLAPSNAGGYPGNGLLPSVSINNSKVQISYLMKDLLTSVNKTQGVANVNGIYTQTGINLVTWGINSKPMPPAEIGQNLHLGGGFLYMYDGVKPVEHGFHVYPEDIGITTATGAGGLIAQQYYYQFTYEWTDARGNLHRSAPSIPVVIVTTTASSTNTLNVPTLRLTAKTGGSKVRIVGYRGSTAQQNYYQITSITAPVLNDTTVDYVTITDTLSDPQILGNQLIYTTGGTVENISAPAIDAMTLYKSRLIMISAENKNQLWYSKQVIQGVPVETTNLFTRYIAPTAGAQGSTGYNTALSAMDDKLIIFKKNAIYYMTGNGPDNTGANNDFSEPNYITSTAGCTNSASIVFTPEGLMFQSDKGIWILKRDLSTEYIGAAVEDLTTGATVLSSVNVPGTNQVRFTLDSGVTLMYDYYYGQWGTFTNIPGISSTLYQNLHTYVNALGSVFQETPGAYVDGSNPVLMSFSTGWLALAGLQGFERAYYFYLLGTYLTPHKLSVGISYDFDPSIIQISTTSPDNYNPAYGLDVGPYGSGDPYGGASNVEQWRVFLQRQKCQSFRITVTEVYDSSLGVPAGAGLTLSGINLVVGVKKGWNTLKGSKSVG